MFALVGVQSAFAVSALTYSSDTTVVINGNNYTILSGSEATSVVVNATQIIVVVPTTKTFSLRSSSGFTLANDQSSAVLTCSNGVSTLAYTSSGSTTITITPTTAIACGITTGSGGGGGTSGDTVSPTGTISINAGAATTSTLSATLTLTATDNIGVTQMMISNDSGFAGGSWESYAASKTWTLTSGDGAKTVYVKFKDAAGNISLTASDSITVSGSGTVVIPEQNDHKEGCAGGNLFNTSTGKPCVNNVGNEHQTSSIKHGPYNFGTVTLKNGSHGDAVKELQKFLNAKLNLGLMLDGKLGPKTIAVIKKWQKDHKLVADGLIGPKTKAMMNAEAD